MASISLSRASEEPAAQTNTEWFCTMIANRFCQRFAHNPPLLPYPQASCTQHSSAWNHMYINSQRISQEQCGRWELTGAAWGGSSSDNVCLPKSSAQPLTASRRWDGSMASVPPNSRDAKGFQPEDVKRQTLPTHVLQQHCASPGNGSSIRCSDRTIIEQIRRLKQASAQGMLVPAFTAPHPRRPSSKATGEGLGLFPVAASPRGETASLQNDQGGGRGPAGGGEWPVWAVSSIRQQ